MAIPFGVFPTFLTGKTPSPSSFNHVSYTRPFASKLRINATAGEPKKRLTGFTKTRPVSPELKDFLGGKPEVSRSIALQEIWAYIKLNQLQDPMNKQVIVCDEKLKTIFGGKERVGFLEVSGLLTPHMIK